MSRARHMTHGKHHAKHREAGGATETGGNPAVFSLAKEHTSIGHIPGGKAKHRLDRKRGGGVHHHASGGSAANPYSEGKQPPENKLAHGGRSHHADGGHDGMHHGLHGAHKEGHPHHQPRHHHAHGEHHPHHAGHMRGRK